MKLYILDIKPTPKLNKKDSQKFLERVEAKASVVSHPICFCRRNNIE